MPQYEEDPVGGVARFATILNNVKRDLAAQGRSPIILFSGDFVGPSLLSTLTHGAHIIEAFNLLGVHYGTFGNHEFDYGYTSLVHRLDGVDGDIQSGENIIDFAASTTQWIMTNMSEASGQPVGGDKYTKRTVLVPWETPGGVLQVGILAVSSNWLPGCSQLKKGEVTYEDYIESARAAASQLKQDGADIVLALTHCRHAEDIALTTAVPEIDLLLGGHDHFYRRDRQQRIVKGGEEWRWLNHVTIDNGDVRTERYDVYQDTPTDEKMTALVDKYVALRDARYKRVLCHTAFLCDPTEAVVRYKESEYANWVCDMISADYSEQAGDQTADIVILQGFEFSGKQAIPAGAYTLGDLMNTFSRPCSIVALRLSGADIIASLTLGAKHLPTESGGIHHVNQRLKYTVVIPQDRSKRPFVKDVLFNDAPIDEAKIYSVCVTSNLAKGNFGYSWMKSAERIVDEEFSSQIQDVVKMYCEKHFRDATPVPSPGLGRIKIVAE